MFIYVQNFLERLREGMNETVSEIGWMDGRTKADVKVTQGRR